MTDTIIHVTVRERTRILYDGNATGLTSKNSKGVFDILLNHSNFISLVTETLVIHTVEGRDVSLPMNNALIKVKENKVEVYVGVKR